MIARFLAGVSMVDDESRPTDMFYQGDADVGVRRLAEELGWEEELDEMIKKGHEELETLWEERKKIAGDDEEEENRNSDGEDENAAVKRAQNAAKSIQSVMDSEENEDKIPLDEVQAMQKLIEGDLESRKDITE